MDGGFPALAQGEDASLSIHPDRLRTANTIYCAFPRMFGGAAARQVPGSPGPPDIG
ncbi:MAG: hypothetical protein IPN91_11220 [Holophagaceae bacterium]|uniref:Uncharacterized protein n=1 Tax=Candidatus Geothrix odensensis TaxID=2954440 RepID=A0A936F3M7_9BACT|nr:hypothetical protein [Candidatus Geothrix odensensis]